MTTIRPAAKADAKTIKALVKTENLDPTTLKWQNFLIAEDAGEIVGIGQIKPYPDCQELGSLIVLPEYRKRGVGALLIAALEKRADSSRPLYLMCEARMQTYYARFGFSSINPLQAPRTIKLKLTVMLPFMLVGWRFAVMRKHL